MSGFFERWSRNKRSTDLVEPEPGIVEIPAEQALPVAIEPEVEFVDEEAVKALPSLDEITAGFDIKPFLKQGIPRALKNAALRKAWLANPAIRDHKDVAVDYWWDWNTPGGVPGNGGRINPESALRFAKSLFASERTDAQEEVEAASLRGSMQVEAVEPIVESRPAEDDNPGETWRPDEAEPALDEIQVSAVSRFVEEPIQRRRHGSALPE